MGGPLRARLLHTFFFLPGWTMVYGPWGYERGTTWGGSVSVMALSLLVESAGWVSFGNALPCARGCQLAIDAFSRFATFL